MNELKIGEVGMVAGKLVKCVERRFEGYMLCWDCSLIYTYECLLAPCKPYTRNDGRYAIFIPPSYAEVEEYQRKEGGK